MTLYRAPKATKGYTTDPRRAGRRQHSARFTLRPATDATRRFFAAYFVVRAPFSLRPSVWHSAQSHAARFLAASATAGRTFYEMAKANVRAAFTARRPMAQRLEALGACR